MKHAIVLLLAAASLIAADATGRWSGALIVKDDVGERSLPALFVLNQEGAVVTGTGGPPNDPSPLLRHLHFFLPKEFNRSVNGFAFSPSVSLRSVPGSPDFDFPN